MFKNSVSPSHKTDSVSIIETNRLNAFWANSLLFIRISYGTYKYIPWIKCGVFLMLKQVVHIVTTVFYMGKRRDIFTVIGERAYAIARLFLTAEVQSKGPPREISAELFSQFSGFVLTIIGHRSDV
jgi:hypothetical protein